MATVSGAGGRLSGARGPRQGGWAAVRRASESDAGAGCSARSRRGAGDRRRVPGHQRSLRAAPHARNGVSGQRPPAASAGCGAARGAGQPQVNREVQRKSLASSSGPSSTEDTAGRQLVRSRRGWSVGTGVAQRGQGRARCRRGQRSATSRRSAPVSTELVEASAVLAADSRRCAAGRRRRRAADPQHAAAAGRQLGGQGVGEVRGRGGGGAVDGDAPPGPAAPSSATRSASASRAAGQVIGVSCTPPSCRACRPDGPSPQGEVAAPLAGRDLGGEYGRPPGIFLIACRGPPGAPLTRPPMVRNSSREAPYSPPRSRPASGAANSPDRLRAGPAHARARWRSAADADHLAAARRGAGRAGGDDGAPGPLVARRRRRRPRRRDRGPQPTPWPPSCRPSRPRAAGQRRRLLAPRRAAP